MRAKIHSAGFLALAIIVLLSLLGFSPDSVSDEDEILGEICRILSDLPKIQDDVQPDIPDEFEDYIVTMQPASGDVLLAIIADPQDALNRRATNTFLKTWQSMSPEQIDTYFKVAMTAYIKFRPQYPQGTQAYVGAGYTIRYGWGGWPRGEDVKMRTSSYKILDGQFRGSPHAELNGKPFHYEGPMASSGGIPVASLDLGKHTVQAVTDYEVTYKGTTFSGTAKSQEATFKIVPAYTSNELAAPDDPALDEFVQRAFRFKEVAEEIENVPRSSNWQRDPWEPQMSSMAKGSSDEYALHMPLWEVTEPLPVDLCFQVEFRLEQTGDIFEGDRLVVLKGKKSSGYFAPERCIQFAKDNEGLVPLRIVLRPSPDVALSDTRVTQYYTGTLSSDVLRARTYWFRFSSAKPWERQLKNMLNQLDRKEKINRQVLYGIEGLASLNPYRRNHGALSLAQMPGRNVTPAIPFLIKLLAGIDTPLEAKAAENAEDTLAAIGPPAVEPLIAALKDQNPDVRESAAYILGSIADDRAVEPLIMALKDLQNHVREAAAVALGQLKDPRAVEPLNAALNDYDANVRDSAAAALKSIENQLKLTAYRSQLVVSPMPVGHFPDPNIEHAVRFAIGKPTGQIKNTDLVGAGLIVFDAQSSQIKDLRGLEHCTDLIVLRLADNQIQDIAPLSGLTNLTDLSLSGNELSNAGIVPLAVLTRLERLYLDNNRISDIAPLAMLANLSRLQIANNQISDISPLSGLGDMTSLWLTGNKIADLSPLAGLTQLGGLALSKNQITDISPLADLKNLTSLNIRENQVTDISALSRLDNMTYLYLHKNQIADIGPLSKMTNLTTLELSRNRITDLNPLSNLSKLNSLGVKHNQISNLNPLSTLVKLESLEVSNNPIRNIGVLAGLSNLTRLHASNTQIADISILSPLTKLSALNVSANKIIDIRVLANFQSLTYLYLTSNQISDISVLSKLTNLKNIALQSNRITDISSLVENKSISGGTSINLSGNPLNDESLNIYIPALKARGVSVYYAPLSMK